MHRFTFVPADEYLFGFLLLTSTLYFQLGSGSGLDVIKYPTCSNTCPLATYRHQFNGSIKAITFIVFAFFYTQTYSQVRNLDNIKRTQIKDTRTHHMKAGFYLYMPAPDEQKKKGFRFTDKPYFIAENEFLSLKNIDTIYKSYDPNVKSNILNVRFNEDEAEQLRIFTMKWQGFSIGLFIKNKLLAVATLPRRLAAA